MVIGAAVDPLYPEIVFLLRGRGARGGGPGRRTYGSGPASAAGVRWDRGRRDAARRPRLERRPRSGATVMRRIVVMSVAGLGVHDVPEERLAALVHAEDADEVVLVDNDEPGPEAARRVALANACEGP